MRKFIYQIARICMRAALYSYFGQIKFVGLERIPKKGSLLFLPNHQNALLDALLIAVRCQRKPYFLTRSDVFSNALFRSLFSFFKMLPVYRMRDGRDTLVKNEDIFQRCADLLCQGEAVVVFPEANHNLDRRVRPLSKGFTRILFRALNQCEKQQIQLLPVGVNYLGAASFPDLSTIGYGKAIAVTPFYDPTDLRTSSVRIKNEVSLQLRTLTTHVPEEMDYEQVMEYLTSLDIDFQDPDLANREITGLPQDIPDKPVKKRKPTTPGVLKVFFYMINFPVLIPWLWIKKNKIPEVEFTSTFRFAYALLVYPPVYLFSYLFLGMYLGYAQALVLISFHFGCNQIYIKSIKPSVRK